MGRQHVEATAQSSAPPESVWALLADISTWSSWGGWDSSAHDAGPTAAAGEIRRLRRGRSETVEEVVAFEPPSRLGYRLLSGLPVKDYVAYVTLAPLSSGGTRIVWSASFDGRWPLQGRVMAFALGRFFPDIVRRLAAAAEGTTSSMSDQQNVDDRDEKDPYPADQQFGAKAAADQEKVDRGEQPSDGDGDEPRAGNKA